MVATVPYSSKSTLNSQPCVPPFVICAAHPSIHLLYHPLPPPHSLSAYVSCGYRLVLHHFIKTITSAFLIPIFLSSSLRFHPLTPPKKKKKKKKKDLHRSWSSRSWRSCRCSWSSWRRSRETLSFFCCVWVWWGLGNLVGMICCGYDVFELRRKGREGIWICLYTHGEQGTPRYASVGPFFFFLSFSLFFLFWARVPRWRIFGGWDAYVGPAHECLCLALRGLRARACDG